MLLQSKASGSSLGMQNLGRHPTAMKLLLPSQNIPQVIPLCAEVENTVLNEIRRNFYS